jgi:sporulation protein YunB
MKRHRIILLPAVVIVLVATVGIFIFLEHKIRSVRDELSMLEANTTASSALTAGLETALEKYRINYDDIVTFEYDSDGNIKSLSTDILILNTLGNEIGTNTDNLINEIGVYCIRVPLTSLLGIQLLAGIGPQIPFYVTMRGITSTSFENDFSDEGINQTRHQIYMNVKIKTYIIFSGEVTVVEYESKICIAESIIVGATPGTFADF